MRTLEITIKATPKEIADLVKEVQSQQNLNKLLCRYCAGIRKAYIGYVAIYALFLFTRKFYNKTK